MRDSQKNALIKFSLGILSDLDFDFWIKSNDYYSPDIFSTNVKTGFNHAKKAGLIGEFEKRIICNLDLINIIDERINLVNEPDSYSDDDLLIIFDLIQAWGGPTGRNPYVFQNGPRIIKRDHFAATYRAAVQMLYQVNEESDYDVDVLPIKEKIEELPQVSESFSTKHLSFWSRFLKNCPNLVIYDTRMREIIKAANNHKDINEIKYKDFINALKDAEEVLGLDINEIERAIFAFSSNYFQNDKFILRNHFKIDHLDIQIAEQLACNEK